MSFPANVPANTTVQKTKLHNPAALGTEIGSLLASAAGQANGYQCLVQYVPGNDATVARGEGGYFTITYFPSSLNGSTVTAVLALATISEPS